MSPAILDIRNVSLVFGGVRALTDISLTIEQGEITGSVRLTIGFQQGVAMMDTKKSMAGRVALITGPSRGIGAALARHYAASGAECVLVGRPSQAFDATVAGLRAAGHRIDTLLVNLGRAVDVDQVIAHVHAQYGRLDILIGNAGINGRLEPIAAQNAAEWEDIFAINVHANWRLIHGLDGLLRASSAGRAVFVTSGAAKMHKATWSGYAVTKAALESLVLIYAAECLGSNVKVNLLAPGPTRTEMRAQAYPNEDPMTLKPPEAIVDLFALLSSPECQQHGERIEADKWLAGSAK